MSEADYLNRIERLALKGKASGKDLRLLVRAYAMHNIKIPTKIRRQLK